MYKRWILGIILLIPYLLHAQEVNRYMVFFKDKEQNTYSLQEPRQFLSSRAIDRRIRQEIPLNVSDLPVSPAYIQSVEEKGAYAFYSSRWFNALLIQADERSVEEVQALPFVEGVMYVAPGAKLEKTPSNANGRKKKSRERLTSVLEDVQNTILGVPEMHQQGFSGEGKLIAVLDGGFLAVDQLPYFSHLFEKGLLQGQHDFTTSTANVFRYSTHGTKALSTISAIDSSFTGTAPASRILLAVTEDVASEYVIEEYNWLLAAEWADSAGADVITASLGYNTFDDPSMNYTYADMNGETTVSAKAAQMASEKGMVVVVSAGNSGSEAWKYIVTPADADGVISVGAIQENNQIASFSSRGPSSDGQVKPEVVALGHRTIVANEAGGFTLGYGTSFAAPQIAGFVASAWGAFPELKSTELRQLILSSGDRVASPDSIYGWGKPNFARLQSLILGAEPQDTGEKVRVYPNPVQKNQVFIEFKEGKGPTAEVTLFSSAGQQLLNRQKLREVNGSAGTFILDLDLVQEGVLILHIFRADQQYVHKILK